MSTPRALLPMIRLTRAHYPLIHRPMQRLVMGVVRDLRVELAKEKRYASSPVPNFSKFLTQYFAKNVPYRMDRMLRGPFGVYLDAVRKEAAQWNVLTSPEDEDQFKRWVTGYFNGFVRRFSESSEVQIAGIIDKHFGDVEELKEKVENRLAGWAKTRATKIASDEMVRSENGAALRTWQSQGVRYVKWVTGPKDHHCPYCRALNGKKIRIGGYFMVKGEVMYVKVKEGEIQDVKFHPGKARSEVRRAEKGWTALKVYGDKKHPPIHRGCVCRIVPA